MGDKLTCPVCERSGVPPDSKKCPQCDADLTCFQALDSLAEGSTVPAKMAEKEGRSSNRRAVLFLLLLLVLLAASFFFFSRKAKDRVQDLNQRVVALRTDLKRAEQKSEQIEQVLCVLPDSEKVDTEEDTFEDDDPLIYEEDKVEAASSKLSQSSKSSEGSSSGSKGSGAKAGKETGTAVSDSTKKVLIIVIEVVSKKIELGRSSEYATAKWEKPQVESLPVLPEERWSERTFLYLIKETDTLWDLAEHFYGDGKYYPVIMEQNPGLVISDIHDEEILRLFNERSVLEDIYTRRIERRDGLVLWKHKVRAGETRQSIENRFASPGFSGRVFYEKAPNIQPGATVRIILH
ncbi:MAG: LysM peptidoglycan-binding domain-containing protein [Candidatus Electrothrix sp. GM3_4]|nr:LysM peptidoglycan-binding domain-containing protein [Candidatus Electrothrix sp. GM3_4]